MVGDGVPEDLVGAARHEKVELLGRQLDAAAALELARDPPVKVGEAGHFRSSCSDRGPAAAGWDVVALDHTTIVRWRLARTAKKSHQFSTMLPFPTSSVPCDFGAALATFRKARGWSQQRLAERASLERATIIRLEAGRRRPTADTVFRLEAALDLEPGEMVPAWPEWSPIGSSSLGARSRARRRELGLSLVQVAHAAGVSAAMLSRFERETGRTPALRRVATGNASARDELVSDRLAIALGFANRVAHERYCRRGV